MPFVKAESLPGEPILIVTYTGHVTAEDVRVDSATIAEYVDSLQQYAYIIADISEVTSSFLEALNIAKDHNQRLPGTATDPRLMAILVGTNAFAKLYVELLRKQGNSANVAMFTTMEKALEVARNLAAKTKET